MSENLAPDLLELLGEEAFFALVEAHAGIRLYVPADPHRSKLPETIGHDAALRLARAYPGGYIRVPLAREFRTVRYTRSGMTNSEIARRLGVTERGVEQLLKRARTQEPVRRPRKKDPRQLDMF